MIEADNLISLERRHIRLFFSPSISFSMFMFLTILKSCVDAVPLSCLVDMQYARVGRVTGLISGNIRTLGAHQLGIHELANIGPCYPSIFHSAWSTSQHVLNWCFSLMSVSRHSKTLGIEVRFLADLFCSQASPMCRALFAGVGLLLPMGTRL